MHDASNDEVPVQVLPLPVTVQEFVSVVLQVIFAESCERTRYGEAVNDAVGVGDRHIDWPVEQNCGRTQVARSVVEQSAFVCLIV